MGQQVALENMMRQSVCVGVGMYIIIGRGGRWEGGVKWHIEWKVQKLCRSSSLLKSTWAVLLRLLHMLNRTCNRNEVLHILVHRCSRPSSTTHLQPSLLNPIFNLLLPITTHPASTRLTPTATQQTNPSPTTAGTSTRAQNPTPESAYISKSASLYQSVD